MSILTKSIEQLVSLDQKEYLVSGRKAIYIPSLVIAKTIGKRRTTSKNFELRLSKPGEGDRFSMSWTISSPNLVQAYNGLQILGLCPAIEEDTLCACYYVADRNLSDTTEHYLNSLKNVGFADIETKRLDVLAQKINEDIFLDKIVYPALYYGVPFINVDEIEEEVRIGNLSNRSSFAVRHVANQ